jgi:hypothetical protein
MKLFCDLLDKQLVEKSGTKIGRVDGLVAIWDGKQPRVVALETGLSALARRSGFARVLRRLFGSPDVGAFRIAWAKVRKVDLEIRVDLRMIDTPLHRLHAMLRRELLNHIPGSANSAKK